MKLTSDELESCHEGLRDMGLLRVLDTTEADPNRKRWWETGGQEMMTSTPIGTPNHM